VTKLDSTVAILITIGYDEELIVEGSQRGGRDVLGKPYRRAELLDRIRQALENRGRTELKKIIRFQSLWQHHRSTTQSTDSELVNGGTKPLAHP
jgi:DNA-binding response OmpR family regulator